MPTMSPDVSDFKVIEVRLSLNCQTEVSCSEAMLVEHLLLSLPLVWSSTRFPGGGHHHEFICPAFELSDCLLNVPFLS